MNPISTGYKPEWGLGAVYQGINAADSEALNQEELIKSFLANQRETQMQPLDVQVRGLEAAQAGVQNTPDMLKRFAQSKQAGYDKAQRENELGALMQPFLKEKAPLEGKAQVDQALQNSNLLELQKTIDSGVDRNGQPISPQDMQVLNQEYQKQIALRGQTPELFGKLAVEDKKGQLDLEKQRLVNEGHLAAANASSSRSHQSEVVKALSPIMGYLKNIDTQLAKIDTTETEMNIYRDLLSKGKKPSQQDVAKVKSQLKAELQAEKSRYHGMVQYMMKQIPGMSEMPATPEQKPNVIKLD